MSISDMDHPFPFLMKKIGFIPVKKHGNICMFHPFFSDVSNKYPDCKTCARIEKREFNRYKRNLDRFLERHKDIIS